MSPWHSPTWVSSRTPVTSPAAHSRSPARSRALTRTPCSPAAPSRAHHVLGVPVGPVRVGRAGALLVLAVGGRRAPHRVRQVAGRVLHGRSLPQPTRKASRDLLDEPGVAVRVTERHERAVALALQRRAGRPSLGAGVVEDPAGVVEHRAHVGAVADELIPGGADVGDDQLQALGRPRCSRGDPSADDDRARRAGRGQLHHPEVRAGGEVGLQPSAQAPVEVLGLVHVRDRHHHDLQFHVHYFGSCSSGAG